jgi:hypothetical protein
MIKKANPTLEGQLLEYLESAPDDKSEVMWNVLQHLRARQRGETIENPTIEGRIAEYFETASLEKAEVLFNIVELKLAKRMEREAAEAAAEADDPKEAPAKAKRPRPEGKSKAKASAPTPEPVPAVEPAPAAGSASTERASAASRTPDARNDAEVIEVPAKEPVIVPDEELSASQASSPGLEDLPPEISDDLSFVELDEPVIAEVDVA